MEFTREGAENFVEAITNQSWDSVANASPSSLKVNTFQDILDRHMKECFKLKTTVRRESDPPWINDNVRRMWRKGRKIYDKEGRSWQWKRLKKASDKMVQKRAEKCMARQKSIITAPDASRSFYKNVKGYKTKEKPRQFDVRDLYEDKEDVEVAESLAVHFNSISSEFEGLDENLALDSVNLALPAISESAVESRLKSFRKPKSMVRGDIFPALVNRVAPQLAKPLADIFNVITTTGEWPEVWKIEYMTPIPKTSMPSGPDDLRNIFLVPNYSVKYMRVLSWND